MPKFELKLSEEAQREIENPLLGTKKYHDDVHGSVERPVLLRDPVTPAERQKVRELWKNNIPVVRKALVKKDCPKCHGRGFHDIPDYPGDPWYAKLMSSLECDCIWQD